MTIALIDDRAVAMVLRGDAPPELDGYELATTGCWYVRLCTALFKKKPSRGALARSFSNLPLVQRDLARAALHRLPDAITLVSLRELGPTIGQLRDRHPLNLLSAEALAAARHLQAHVLLSTSSPRLEAALDEEGLSFQLLDQQLR